MDYSNLLLIVAIVAIFYFLTIGNATIQNFENATSSQAASKDMEEIDNLDDVFNDITQGNPISYANRDAPTNDKTQTQQDPYVYFGTPNDLKDNYMALPEQSMTYFANNVASLECCPSNYSSNGGCVCWTPAQYPENRRRNSAISPSS